MRTNYFNTRLTNTNTTIFRYQISFGNEDGLSRPKKRRYAELLLQQQPFASVTLASDFLANIYTTEKLKLNNDRAEYKVIIHERLESPFPTPTPDENDGQKAARVRKTKSMKVELVGSYGLNDLYKYVSAPTGGNYAGKGDVVQAMNIIFNHAAGANQVLSAQPGNKFFPYAHHNALNTQGHKNHESWELGEGLLAIRGYYSSVRLGPQRVLLNLNVATGAFYESLPLNELINKFMRGRPLTNQYAARQCVAFIKKLKCAINYLKEKDTKGKEKSVLKIRTVNGFTSSPFAQNADQAKFDHEGKRVSVKDFFKSQHKITLKFPELPVINCGTSKDQMLIPAELLLVLGGQPARRLLSAEQTTNMIAFAGRPPNANAQSIEGSGLQVMEATTAQQVKTIRKFGIEMQNTMITVPARILPAPNINFKKPMPTRDGGWNLLNQQFFKPSTMSGIFCSFQVKIGRELRVSAQNFVKSVDMIVREMAKYGVRTQTPPGPGGTASAFYKMPAQIATLGDMSRESFTKILEVLDAKFKGAAANNIKWILISIPEKNQILYAIIKFLGDVRYGINTVLIQDSNTAKVLGFGDKGPDLMLVGNLALKFSIKSGGQPWSLNPADLPLIDDLTMVVGLDVTHPSPTSRDGAPSIAAIVASYDKGLSNWPADGMSQTSRKEMIEGLPELMIGRLEYFRKLNKGRLPTKIIVFRDGVSEGQFNTVLDVEFKSMVQAFDKLYGAAAKHPKVSIIVSLKSSFPPELH